MPNKLFDLCKNYQHIVCYGAGDYAAIVSLYLESMGIIVEKFIVSDISTCTTKRFFDYKVIDIHSYNRQEENTLVLVAVNDQYQKEIVANLKKAGIEKYFLISRSLYISLIENGDSYALKFFEKLLIHYSQQAEQSRIREYDAEIAKIRERYKYVSIRFAGGTIGCLIDEVLYYNDTQNTRNFYTLLCVSGVEGFLKNKFIQPNSFLIKKAFATDFSTVYKDNVDFWMYFFRKYPYFFKASMQDYCQKKVLPYAIEHIAGEGFGSLTKRYVSFTDKELESGEKQITALGIKKPYICFFSRDSVYYKKNFKFDNYFIDLVDEFRNSNVKEYYDCADFFYTKNVMLVRMGAISDRNFHRDGSYDYANNGRTPFLDFYLNANALFFIGDSSGAASIIGIFSKPTVLINMTVMTVRGDVPTPYFPERDIMIFQKYYSKKKGRCLTFREMLACEMRAYQSDEFHYSRVINLFEFYKKNDIVPVKNTAQEIMQVAKEMYYRLNGSYQYTDADEKMQLEYRKIIDSQEFLPLTWRINCRVGADFLRDNQWMLE